MAKNREILGWLGCSSVLGAFSFVVPDFGAYLIFFLFIPLFYCALKYNLSFWHGIYWGFIFWGLHLFGIIMLMYERGFGRYRMIIGVLIIIYYAMHAGIWFWLANKLKRRLPLMTADAFGWIGATYLYFSWVTKISLWPCGVSQGYCLGSPFILASHKADLLWLLPIMGKELFLLTFIALQFFAASIILYKKNSAQLVALFYLPLLSPMNERGERFPPICNEIGFVEPPATTNDWQWQAEDINYKIAKLLMTHPYLKIIVMPESSFTLPLNCYDQVLDIWHHNALAHRDDVYLIIGSPRRTNNKNYNSLYIVNRSRITNHYDKIYLMIFTEFIPLRFEKFSFCNNIFLNNKKEFSSKKNCVGNFEVKEQNFEPYLCSDLYFGTCRNNSKSIPILFAVNDSWFSTLYMKHLMKLYATFIAIEQRRDLLYICHSHACWINKLGKTKLLAQ